MAFFLILILLPLQTPQMMDSSGFPFSLELNSLESIIDPPSTLKKVTQVVAGGAPALMKSDTVAQPATSYRPMDGRDTGTSTTTYPSPSCSTFLSSTPTLDFNVARSSQCDPPSPCNISRPDFFFYSSPSRFL